MVKRLGLLLGLGALACSTTEPRTQLMLVADTDIPELDTIQFEVQGPDDEEPHVRRGPAHDDEPVSLALEHTKGKLGPFTVTARGFIGIEDAISRTHEVFFVPGKTLTVPLHLLAACRISECADPVCSERGCIDVRLREGELLPYSAELPQLQATDAGPADDSITWCTGAGWINTQTDPLHCGACGAACPEVLDVPNAAEMACREGTCSVTCEALWGDCDGNLENGCEQRLTDRFHCGACGRPCRGGGDSCSPTGVCMR